LGVLKAGLLAEPGRPELSLSDGQDPGADPVGYAQAQVLQLRQLTISEEPRTGQSTRSPPPRRSGRGVGPSEHLIRRIRATAALMLSGARRNFGSG
jgi:hypothetical protein